MKYVIVGGGPTGLSLGYALVDGGHDVCLIEKDNQLGGSWNSQWIEESYWSENSPRILISGHPATKLLLRDLQITNKDLLSVYGNIIKLNLKMFMLNKKNCTLLDNLKIIVKIFNFSRINKTLTVQDWLNESTLTDGGKNFIKILCITINDLPEKTNLKEFIHTCRVLAFATKGPKQFKDANDWHNKIEKFIIENGGSILKGTEVISILEENNKVNGVVVRDGDRRITQYYADRVVLCCQSTGLLNILEGSECSIKNNWMDYKIMRNWCLETYYSSFGFQIHFDKDIEFPMQWCWSCEGDWNVIILPVSQWLGEISKDDNVKSVWSCCVTNNATKSKRLNKTLNECTKDEALDECLNQIKDVYDLPEPYRITFSDGLKYSDGIWRSKNTGFTCGKLDYLPIEGNINNLFALGCFTEGGRTVAHMGTAIAASIKFLNSYEPDITSFHNKSKSIDFILSTIKYLIIIIALFYLIMRIKRK